MEGFDDQVVEGARCNGPGLFHRLVLFTTHYHETVVLTGMFGDGTGQVKTRNGAQVFVYQNHGRLVFLYDFFYIGKTALADEHSEFAAQAREKKKKRLVKWDGATWDMVKRGPLGGPLRKPYASIREGLPKSLVRVPDIPFPSAEFLIIGCREEPGKKRGHP